MSTSVTDASNKAQIIQLTEKTYEVIVDLVFYIYYLI